MRERFGQTFPGEIHVGGTVLEFFEDADSDTCPVIHTHTHTQPRWGGGATPSASVTSRQEEMTGTHVLPSRDLGAPGPWWHDPSSVRATDATTLSDKRTRS